MDNRDFMAKSRSSRGDLRGLTVSARDTGGSFDALGLSVGKVATGFVALAAARSAARFLSDASRESASLTRELTKSAAIQDLSADQFGRMREEAQRLARDPAIKDFAPELAQGYFYLASAGQDAEQQIASLETVALFASAGQFDLARATDLATDAQSALGLTSKDAEQNLANLTLVTDTLVRANTLANASVEQFSTALTNDAGASARAVGEDIADVTAVLAAFADQGTKDAAAGTQYSIVMRDLQTKALANAAAFREAGISVFDTAGEFRDFADIIGDVERRVDGLSDAAQKQALLDLGFSDKSVKSLQTLLGTSEKIREYEAALRDAGGTTERVANKSLSDFDKASKRATAEWREFQTAFGDGLNDASTPVLEVTADVVRGLNANIGNMRRNLTRWFGGSSASQPAAAPDPVSQPQSPRRAAEVEAERLRRQQELLDRRRTRVDLTDLEKTGDTAANTAADLLAMQLRLGNVQQAYEDGTMRAEHYAGAVSHIREQIDLATGGARRYALELAREIELIGAVEEQRKLAELDRAGASLDDLDRVAALQAENRFREEAVRLQRELNDLQDPRRNRFRDLEAAGLSVDQITHLTRLQQQIEDTSKAQQIKDSLATPQERLKAELAEARRLHQQGLLDDETMNRKLADAREQWAGLNSEAREHQRLVDGAADAYSTEAWERIFGAGRRPASGSAAGPATGGGPFTLPATIPPTQLSPDLRDSLPRRAIQPRATPVGNNGATLAGRSEAQLNEQRTTNGLLGRLLTATNHNTAEIQRLRRLVATED